MLATALVERADRFRFNALKRYSPYPKQAEFHRLGTEFSERMMGAGNQTGKTWCGAHEAAYHATGLYPDDWEGARFEKPTVGWVGGVTGEVIRDTTQKMLVGRMQDKESIGTTAIPKDCIIELVRALGIKDLLDHVKVKHVSGGTSLIFFKSYEKGREKFQGETIDWAWLDEEPPADIYSETLTRTNNGQLGQFLFVTFTPLLGMTDIAHSFYKDPGKYKILVVMTIYDVDHYTDEEKEKIVESYPAHEREARAKGIPILGSGRIFPVAQEKIEIEPIKLPDHWVHLGGLDFGWDHPQAAVHIVWDRDADVIYVTNEYKARETTPDEAGQALRHWGTELKFAWPHDGYQHDKGSGKQLADQYKGAGLKMLREHATHPEGGNGVEAGLMDMLDRMRTGRFKVFSTCPEWFGEFMLYHRKDGKVVKLMDDLMAATRYAIMMIRHAAPLQPDKPTELNFSSLWN
jgi:phage terminase large subunit-like protein